jgi:hypothetical protein
MLRNAVYCFLFYVLFLNAPASAQSLWNGTNYGMSVDEVRATVPKAIAPDKPNRLADGAQELLRLTNVEIVGKTFDAQFFFRNGRLSQVTLSLEKGHTFHQATLTLNALSDALRAKYGREISHENDRTAALNRITATWLSGKTNINVLAIGVGDFDATLNVNYQMRIAREAEKL